MFTRQIFSGDFDDYEIAVLSDAAAGPVSVYVAGSWYQRLRGLKRKRPLEDHEALLLVPCNSIHTIGMKQVIDVLFLDQHGIVIAVHSRVGSGKIKVCHKASAVMEMAAGCAENNNFHCGARLNGIRDRLLG